MRNQLLYRVRELRAKIVISVVIILGGKNEEKQKNVGVRKVKGSIAPKNQTFPPLRKVESKNKLFFAKQPLKIEGSQKEHSANIPAFSPTINKKEQNIVNLHYKSYNLPIFI